jgi:hypothetical protein
VNCAHRRIVTSLQTLQRAVVKLLERRRCVDRRAQAHPKTHKHHLITMATASNHNNKPVPLSAVTAVASAANAALAAVGKPLADADRTGAAAVMELPGGGNIDKIRDIIFGNQMRDYEKRFVRLEERLMKDSSELREEVKRRLEQIESHNRKELETLADRLKSEQDERAGADQELTREVRDLGKTSDKKISQLDEQAIKTARDLRQQLLDQGKQLSEEVRHKFDDLASTIEREATELRGDKTDRAALAGLFTEMALRLSNELHLPSD